MLSVAPQCRCLPVCRVSAGAGVPVAVPSRCQSSLFKLIESGTAKRTRKNRIALAPAFAQHPSHAGPCFIRRIVRHAPSLRTTADVNGIEAFPLRGAGQPKQNKGNQTQDPAKMVNFSQTGANVAKCYWSVAGLFPQMLPVKSLIIKVCFRVSPFSDYTIIKAAEGRRPPSVRFWEAGSPRR